MKGWQTTRLGDVCFDSEWNRALEGSVPYVEIGDIDIDTKNITFKEKGSVRGSVLAPMNSVIVSRVRPTRGAISILEKDASVSSAFTILKPRKSLELGLLFFSLAYSKEFSGYLGEKQKGLLYPSVKEEDVLDYAISYPESIPEQQRIVGILEKVFAGIVAAKGNAERNLQNSRALFESHLQSVFTQCGKGWGEKRLVEVSRGFGRGRSKHRPRDEPSLYNGPYPFIQTGDISNADHWLTDYTQTYSERGLAQSRLWPRGTICIAIVGATVGETAILEFEACFPDSVIGIVVNDQLADNEYVEFLLQSFKALLKQKGKGTARDNINLRTFESQKFPFPPLKRQKEIAATLNALCDETKRLESIYRRKLAALDALKKAVLHKAFAGGL